MAVPSAPTLAARNNSAEVIRLTIGEVADATSYKVFRRILPLTGITAITGEADTELLSKVAHGLTAGDIVVFTSIDYADVPAQELDLDTHYYVIATGLTSDAFKVSLTPAGAAAAFDQDITDAECDAYDLRQSPSDPGYLYEKTGVTPGAVYMYLAKAVNGDGDSAAFTNAVQITAQPNAAADDVTLEAAIDIVRRLK